MKKYINLTNLMANELLSRHDGIDYWYLFKFERATEKEVELAFEAPG
jgi:hypothetical protein